MVRAMMIAGRRIADDAPALVVAEIGNNHGGSMETAMQLIKIAADAGADAVKFQTRNNRQLFTAEAYDAPYNSEAAFGPTYGTHRDALELPRAAYPDLKAYAESLGLVFFSTPFDFDSADFLNDLGVPCFKIASGDLLNIPLIQHVASFGKPVIVSTGGAILNDVLRVVGGIEWQPGQLALMQCTAAYPVQAEEVNLRVIETYRTVFTNVVIGLSDHYSGVLPGPLAYLLGARIFEKHVTYSRAAKGTDHAFSLEPAGLTTFVNYLRAAPLMLGDGVKRPYESEAPGLKKMQKSIVLWRDLPSGHELTEADFQYKSPGGGIPPYRTAAYVGRRLRQPVTADHVLRDEDVEDVQT